MRTNLKSGGNCRGVEQHKGRVGERERERWDLFFSSCPAHSISLPSFPSLLPLRLKTAAEVTVSVSVDLGDDQLVLGMGEGISHDLIHLFEQDQCTVRSDFFPPPSRSERTGARLLQWPHQGAKNSTKTGLLPSTTESMPSTRETEAGQARRGVSYGVKVFHQTRHSKGQKGEHLSDCLSHLSNSRP